MEARIYQWLRLRATDFSAQALLARLRQDTLKSVVAAGGAAWGVWQPLFGMRSNELVLVTAWPGGARPAEIVGDGMPDGATVVEAFELAPTVRPTTFEPVRRDGIYVHRFFEVRDGDVEEMARLSVEGWKTFETADAYRTQQLGLFRPHPRPADAQAWGQMLLVSWYADLASWQRSRQFPPEARRNFVERARLTRTSLPFAMQLAGTAS
jgi:hypothetical protein